MFYAEKAAEWLETGLPKGFDRAFSAPAKDFWLKRYAVSAMMSSDKGSTLAERSGTYGTEQQDKRT